jgi:hypothetical protein
MAFNSSDPFGLGKQIEDVGRSISDGLKQLTQEIQAGSGSASPGPWTEFKASKEGMFPSVQIDGDRWNQLYPYRLVVWDAELKKIVGAGFGQSLKEKYQKISPDSYRISFEPMASAWEFRLPITPQQYSVSTPFTAVTTATQRGIVEEHGGIKFKMINCSGSLGVWANRKSLNGKPENPSILTTLFSGTIEAFQGVTNQIDRTIRSITSNHPAPKPTEKNPEGSDLESTGYYQMLLLDQFLEQYSEFKKQPFAKDWRLVLDIPKENQSFIVTPVQFTYSKSADSPNETKFNFQLKAWRRIDLAEKVAPATFDDLTLTPDLLRKVITAVEEARRTIGASYNLIKAVRSDFQTPFNILREISLFAKDAAGLPAAVIDLPRQIIQDAKSSLKDSMNNLDDASIQLNTGTSKSLKSSLATVKSTFSSREGISDAAVTSGQVGLSAKTALDTDPSIDIFNNPEQNFDLFNLLSVTDVNFNFAQQERIDSDLETIRNTTVDDLITKRTQLLELALQISNAFGAGSQDYSDIYDTPTPYKRIQQMTIDEFSILKSIYDSIQALDSITSTNELDQGKNDSAFEYVGSLASDSNIPFENSLSKIRVPVPFGLNMEQMAARFLGNPERWIEIATLNAMRSPYIDEDGFFYNLLSNADGRQFNVETNQNLYVGQKIVLSSLTQPQTTRRIINIEQISPTNFLITADGLDNLDVFTTNDKAKMRAYLPGTVNSQDQIYIPSEQDVTETFLSRPVPATKGDPLVGLSKIDWLLTESGDIATDAYGDFRLAFGISNLIQALKMKFSTPPNRLLTHPGYGAGLTPGISTADLRDSDVIRQIIKSIQNDPRYGDIISLNIDRVGPKYSISLSVTLADGSGVFPINFVLNG